MAVQTRTARLRDAEARMSDAATYAEWRAAALDHDDASGCAAWKLAEESKRYDHVEIRARLDELRRLRSSGDDVDLLYALNEGIHGNLGGMGRSALYEQAKFGTKQLIIDYVEELVESLKQISSLPENEISWDEKQDFFSRASQCFGRSALMLSGAGSLGHFHTGVLKTLIEHRLLPTVISGSSAGAIAAGVLGTHTDVELQQGFEQEDAFALDQQFPKKKARFGRSQVSVGEVEERIAAAIPDLTFQEAYEKTGRKINVTIAPAMQHQTSRLMNAITSPSVFIRTAVQASCAVPGVFPPVMLMAKNVYGERQPYLPTRRWIDGAVTDDLPAKRLARLYGVNHYIVSQANPLALMLLNGDRYLPVSRATKNIWRFAGREYLRAGEEFSRRYLRAWPDISRNINMYYSVAAQDYTADINIIPSSRFVDPQILLGHLTLSEIKALVREGEHATWPKLEQIRISSEIGRILDKILDDHAQHDIRRVYKRRSKIKAVGAG